MMLLMAFVFWGRMFMCVLCLCFFAISMWIYGVLTWMYVLGSLLCPCLMGDMGVHFWSTCVCILGFDEAMGDMEAMYDFLGNMCFVVHMFKILSVTQPIILH
jgi:hypothetical protein